MLWWSSLETVSTISTIAQWVVAIAGIVALVFGLRESSLQSIADAAESTRFREQLETAREQTEFARKQAEAARQQSESASQQAEEAIRSQMPRSLTLGQRNSLSTELSTAADSGMGKIPIVVASRMMDKESAELGRQISEAIRESGWPLETTEASTHSFAGIAVFCHPEAVDLQECRAVQSAFRKANISFRDDYLDVDRTPVELDKGIYVIIGHK